MTYILIIFFVVILICMGYILCKPFFSDAPVPEPTNEEAYHEIKYQMLQLEIKRIRSEYAAGTMPAEEYKAQLSKMKKEATSLIRLLDLEPKELQNIFPREDEWLESPEAIAAGKEIYCQQCGEEVEAYDKFCMHCGHTL